MRALVAPALALLVVLSLVGCAPDQFAIGGGGSAPAAESADDSDVDAGEDDAAADDNDRVSALGIVPCGSPVKEQEITSDVDLQWKYVYECADRSAYDESVAALDGVYEHPQDESLGNETNLGEWDHFFGKENGKDIDIDLKLSGPHDEPKMTILITVEK